jgi:hypothetical protein
VSNTADLIFSKVFDPDRSTVKIKSKSLYDIGSVERTDDAPEPFNLLKLSFQIRKDLE